MEGLTTFYNVIFVTQIMDACCKLFKKKNYVFVIFTFIIHN
jgi:hypothetical protein